MNFSGAVANMQLTWGPLLHGLATLHFKLVIDACHSSAISFDSPLLPLVNSCKTTRKPWFREFVC